MLIYFLAILAGIICAGIGGEIFVRGSVNISRKLGIAIKVIGVTIAAFATSSPEFAVAVTASLSGSNTISLGDALGSNVVNIMLIFGLALAIQPMQVKFKEIYMDFVFAAGAPVLIGLLALDGVISRPDSLLLLLVFLGWLGWTIKEAVSNNTKQEKQEKISVAQSLLLLSGGLLFLVLAGRFIVYGASNIAIALGVHPFIVGATIVAVATGTPEFATTLIARIKGHDDLSLGTILGSNIFNALFIIAVAALIMPIKIDLSAILLPLTFGVLCVLLLMPNKNYLSKGKGWLLVLGYIVYLIFTVWPRN